MCVFEIMRKATLGVGRSLKHRLCMAMTICGICAIWNVLDCPDGRHAMTRDDVRAAASVRIIFCLIR